MKADTKNLVSMTEHSRNAAQHIQELCPGERLVLMRNDKPVAVLVAPEEIDELEDAAEDLLLLAMVLARLEDDVDLDTAVTLDEVLAAEGLTRADLEEADADEDGDL